MADFVKGLLNKATPAAAGPGDAGQSIHTHTAPVH